MNKFFKEKYKEGGLEALLVYLGHAEFTANHNSARVSLRRYCGLEPHATDDQIIESVFGRECICPDIQSNKGNANTNLRHWHLGQSRTLNLHHNIANFRTGNGGDLFLEGANWWAAVANIKFAMVTSQSQSDIWATSRNIDGRNNVLAWSMLPDVHQRSFELGGRFKLEQRYDISENWLNYNFARKVIAHEIGHALGFGHSPDRGDLMFASILNTNAGLGTGDQRRVINLYGRAIPIPAPPAPPSPQPPVPPTPPKVCRPDKITYTYGDEDFVYTIN